MCRRLATAVACALAGLALLAGPAPAADYAQEAELALTVNAPGNGLGAAVAVSGDGAVAVAGVPGYDTSSPSVSNRGAIAFYSRSGSTWTYDMAIEGPATASLGLGTAVALSADGTVAVAGGDGAGSGQVVVYTPLSGAPTSFGSRALWVAQQTITLGGGDTPQTGDAFGSQVAVSDDGSRIVIGASGRSVSVGQLFVYVRSGASWTREQALSRTGGGSGDALGNAVAISGDGSTIIAGYGAQAAQDGGFAVWTRSGSTWTQQATVPGAAAGQQLGRAVAISRDGATAVVTRKTILGDALVYTRSGATWSLAHTLTGYGDRTSMSADGAVIAAANTSASTNRGEVAVYTRSGAAYAKTQALTLAGANASTEWGVPGLSADGSTLLIGARYADGTGLAFSDNRGRVIAYAQPRAAPGGSGGTPAPSGGSGAAGEGGAVAPTAAVTGPAKPAVKWKRKGARVTATVTPVTGVAYAIAATAKGATARGACKAKTVKVKGKPKATVVCTLKLRKGAWVAAVTPSAGGVAGTAATKPFRV